MTTEPPIPTTLIDKLEALKPTAPSGASFEMDTEWIAIDRCIDVVREHEAEGIILNDRVCVAGRWYYPKDNATGIPVTEQNQRVTGQLPGNSRQFNSSEIPSSSPLVASTPDRETKPCTCPNPFVCPCPHWPEGMEKAGWAPKGKASEIPVGTQTIGTPGAPSTTGGPSPYDAIIQQPVFDNFIPSPEHRGKDRPGIHPKLEQPFVYDREKAMREATSSWPALDKAVLESLNPLPEQPDDLTERVAKAIYFSDPNFHGWKALPKDEIYWETEPDKERIRVKARAAIAAIRERESGWVSVGERLPEDFEDCLIWLKPINGAGEPHWSVRKGSFRNGSFSEWGEDKYYSPSTYKRITHWRRHSEMPPLNELEEQGRRG